MARVPIGSLRLLSVVIITLVSLVIPLFLQQSFSSVHALQGWTTISEPGFGTPNTPDFLTNVIEFNGTLYASALLSGEGEQAPVVVRYDGGTTWTLVSEENFGMSFVFAVSDMEVHNDELYAAVSGQNRRVFKYVSGTTWEELPAIPDNPNRVSALLSAQGNLYVGVDDFDVTTASIFQYDSINNEWDPMNATVQASGGVQFLETDGTNLYVGGFESPGGGTLGIYSVADSSWESLNLNSGFGNANNDSITALTAYNGFLYVGTRNVADTPELWRYPLPLDFDTYDSDLWEQVNPSGFGAGTETISSLVEYNNNLYIHVGNRLWVYDGTDFTEVTSTSFDEGDSFSDNAIPPHHNLIVSEGVLYLGKSNAPDGVSGAFVFSSYDSVDLQLQADSSSVGNVITYELVISNAGPETAGDLVFTASLPVGSSLDTLTPGGYTCVSSAYPTITCQRSSLGIDGSSTITIVVDVPSPGDYNATFAIDSGAFDSNQANNTANLGVTITPTPTPSPTATPTATASPTATVAPTATMTATPSATTTPTPSEVITEFPSEVPTEFPIGEGLYTVRIKVLDESGRPLSGVSVELRLPQSRSVATDSSGEAVFTEVPGGLYRALFTYNDVTYQKDVQVQGAEPVIRVTMNTKESLSWWFWIGIIFIIMVLLALLIMFLRRKENKATL